MIPRRMTMVVVVSVEKGGLERVRKGRKEIKRRVDRVRSRLNDVERSQSFKYTQYDRTITCLHPLRPRVVSGVRRLVLVTSIARGKNPRGGNA